MSAKLIRVLNHVLLKADLRLSQTISRSSILEFLSRVTPVGTNHELLRLGGAGDGGYLVPDDLEGIGHCFSPGVSDIATFEEDLSARGIQCFLADYSVDAPPASRFAFDFEKKFLGTEESERFITLDHWVARKAENKSEFILQMDIEGAEYGVLLDASIDTLRKFRILVIEFHGLDSLCEGMGHELIRMCFAKLLKHFEVVHIHPNNFYKPVVYEGITIPPLMEFTFLRRDRISRRDRKLSYPHRLDRVNVPSKKDVVLPECWYSPG